MLDAETVVFSGDKQDRRVRVHIHEQTCEIVLYFTDLSGEGDVLALEINPRRTDDTLTESDPARVKRTTDAIDPTVVRRVGRKYETYVAYARSAITWNRDGTREALDALRAAGRTKRGLSIDFLTQIATEYRNLIAETNPQPLKTLGENHHVSVSAASRWVKRCRELGLVD